MSDDWGTASANVSEIYDLRCPREPDHGSVRREEIPGEGTHWWCGTCQHYFVTIELRRLRSSSGLRPSGVAAASEEPKP